MEFPTLINKGLILNPINWITILLMVLFAGFVAKLILNWEQSA